MNCIKMKFKNTEDTDVLDIIKNAERALNETGQVNGLITALANITLSSLQHLELWFLFVQEFLG